MSSMILEPLNTMHTYAYQGVYAELEVLVQEEQMLYGEWFCEESRAIERNTKGALRQVYRIVRQQGFLFKMLTLLFILQSVGMYFFFQ
ncbi:MAG: hypothetical protein ACK551_06585 [Vampirovibrionales bacterium]|jgi:hypothetical protein